jgi:uncharacterized protein (TIGR03067 family)
MPSDLEQLQGAWHINSLEVDGAALSPGAYAGAKIVLEGNHFTSHSMGAVYEGTIELQPAKKPKSLTMRFDKGPEKGNANHGIYELTKGGWKLCLSMTGGPAPAVFATEPGSGQAFETLTRAAPPVAEAPAITEAFPPGETSPELEGEWAMVSCIRDGSPLDERMLKTGRRIARNGETQVLFGKQPFLQARFTVDRTQKPMTMDYLITSGASKGKAQLGMYELDGETLKLIFAAPDRPRPTGFETAAGDGKTFTIWKQIAK